MSTWFHTAVTNMISSIHPSILVEEKRKGLQLEQFRNFDFRSMQLELEALFQNTKNIKLRSVPLAYRVGLDGARQYPKAPRRDFLGVSAAMAKVLDTRYRELRVNRFLLGCEQAGVLQQSYLVGYWPDSSGELALQSFMPFQVADIQVTNPLWNGDISQADKVVLVRTIRNPRATPVTQSAMPWCVRFELTPTEAWAVLPDGARLGLFRPDGENPVGRIPLVLTKRAEPVERAEDPILPVCAQDVLSCQIGIVLVLSDSEATTRSQTRVKVLVTGEDADALPKEMPDTAGSWLVLPGDVTATAITMNPPIEKYIRVAETTIYYLSQFRYLRPEAYQASIVTGAARRADAEGFLEEGLRQEGRCKILEEDLLRLIVDVENTRPRALRLELPELDVEFRYVTTPENALQEQQALAVKLSTLMASQVEEVAREENVTTERAREILTQRAEDVRTFLRDSLRGSTPGLDKLAASDGAAAGAAPHGQPPSSTPGEQVPT